MTEFHILMVGVVLYAVILLIDVTLVCAALFYWILTLGVRSAHQARLEAVFQRPAPRNIEAEIMQEAAQMKRRPSTRTMHGD